MAIKQNVEAIFNTNRNLKDFFPKYQNIKYFDLHREHLLYGRIDKECDAILIDDHNLDSLPAGALDIEWIIDFVKVAFNDMKAYYKKAFDSGNLDLTSAFGPELVVRKAYRIGDFEYEYDKHINTIYKNFVQEYLVVDRRHEKINNFWQFVKGFMEYIVGVARYFPITKTGYVLSNHCSPFISGFMLEIADESHGVSNNANITKYSNDPNFEFFARTAKKFGFMVDKNAPWRLVFNIGSGALAQDDGLDQTTGGQKYMEDFGVNYENIFKAYFRKTHREELQNIKYILRTLYMSFYEQYKTYEKMEYVVSAAGEDCYATKVKVERLNLEPYPIILGQIEKINEYFLRIVLKLRMVESNTPHTNKNFVFYMKELTKNTRLFGPSAGLNYINDLTKGMPETKFIRKGRYWYGSTPIEYELRRQAVEKKLGNPDLANLSITGVKRPGS